MEQKLEKLKDSITSDNLSRIVKLLVSEISSDKKGDIMKITHIALCGPVTDGFSYQDNLLPKYHKKSGFEVSMITSRFIWNEDGKIVKDSRREYINEDNIKIIRLDTKKNVGFAYRLKKYVNLIKTIESENPDILFIHGVQFLDIKNIVKYLSKKNNILIYVDNHADYFNSASNIISLNLLHKIIWKSCAQSILPYTKKFYGVLPSRVDFLHEVYDIPREKIELLLMGADDEIIKNTLKSNTKHKIRQKYRIGKKDFLIVTGGKIDSAKTQILLLMEAVKEINLQNVKLIIFGSISSELKEDVYKLIDENKIYFIGWVNTEESYEIFGAADLVIFPWGHSVYWEQVVALGTPIIVKYWGGTTHIDLGGNCIFLKNNTKLEMQHHIEDLVKQPEKYNKMKSIAISDKKNKFLYSDIAKKSIDSI